MPVRYLPGRRPARSGDGRCSADLRHANAEKAGRWSISMLVPYNCGDLPGAERTKPLREVALLRGDPTYFDVATYFRVALSQERVVVGTRGRRYRQPLVSSNGSQSESTELQAATFTAILHIVAIFMEKSAVISLLIWILTIFCGEVGTKEQRHPYSEFRPHQRSPTRGPHAEEKSRRCSQRSSRSA